MTAITHISLADSDGAPFIPVARSRAIDLYNRLARSKQLIGSHRFEVTYSDKTFYVEIRVQRPHVWIYIDSTKCPTHISGLVWIKSFFEPTTEVDGVEYLNTIFQKQSPLLETDVSKLAPVAQQMLTKRPGQFSGKMRKVVQVLLGQGKEVPYSQTAGRTHGVYTASNNVPWIIRISSDGVVAYPMLVCRGKNSPTGLGYTPLPTAEPDEPRVLLDADGIKDAYASKSAFYGLCGWAFSESGTKAANCFRGSKDIYSYSWQYQISIQGDSKTGAPVSATLSLLKEGYIHGPKTTHMKFPRGDIPLALYSFDPYGGNANYRNNCQAPVHCFFDGEALQTYYYVYAPDSGMSTGDVSAGTGRTNGLCTEWLGVKRHAGPYSQTPVPVIQLNNTAGVYRVRDRRNSVLMNTTGPYGIGWETPFVFDNPFVHEVWRLEREYEGAGDNVSNDRTDVLIVTGYEREAAYIATRVSNQSGGHNYKLVYNYWGRYYLDYKNLEDCEATSDLNPLGVQATGRRGENYSDDTCGSGYRVGVLWGFYTWLGASIGTPLRSREQYGFVPGWNGCLNIIESATTTLNANSNDIPTVDIDFPQVTEVTRQLTINGSGNFDMKASCSDAEHADWMQFIEVGMNDQTASIVRDAFDPSRGAYSTAPNNTAGYLMTPTTRFAPYSLPLIRGATMLFVGVP